MTRGARRGTIGRADADRWRLSRDDDAAGEGARHGGAQSSRVRSRRERRVGDPVRRDAGVRGRLAGLTGAGRWRRLLAIADPAACDRAIGGARLHHVRIRCVRRPDHAQTRDIRDGPASRSHGADLARRGWFAPGRCDLHRAGRPGDGGPRGADAARRGATHRDRSDRGSVPAQGTTPTRALGAAGRQGGAEASGRSPGAPSPAPSTPGTDHRPVGALLVEGIAGAPQAASGSGAASSPRIRSKALGSSAK